MEKLRKLPRRYLYGAAGAGILALLCPGGVLLLTAGAVLGCCGCKYLREEPGEGGER